jgi:glycosyltransferase involved in cell wall biosynthesis
MKVTSITIVTPCRNAGPLIARTARSIVEQTAVRSGRVRLQYLVCDGASTDDTVAVVREACGGAVEVISEPDRGMYDALAKGLARATGDVVAYLNAGDFYHPAAFDAVADVFDRRDVEWLTGMFYVCNAREQLVRSLLPLRFRRRFIRQGIYGRFLPVFIQQETTFWSRRLLETVELDRLRQLRLAGDFYLWTRFATQADLHIVDTFLGAFVKHPGQQSEDLSRYRREMDSVRERSMPWDLALALADAASWLLLPSQAKKFLNPRGISRWDYRTNGWG